MILRETGLRMEAYSRNYFCFQVIKWYCNPSPVNGRIFEIDLVQHLSNLCPAMHTWNICVFSHPIAWFVLLPCRRMIIPRWNTPYIPQGRSYHQMAAVEVTSHPHIISPLSFMTILLTPHVRVSTETVMRDKTFASWGEQPRGGSLLHAYGFRSDLTQHLRLEWNGVWIRVRHAFRSFRVVLAKNEVWNFYVHWTRMCRKWSLWKLKSGFVSALRFGPGHVHFCVFYCAAAKLVWLPANQGSS